MAWQMFKIVLRLSTPLHVGAGQVGNVQLARPYLLGKTLWGALTARITRDTRPGATGPDYQAVGRQIKDQLAFSYFYPAIQEEVDLWPWDEGKDAFDWRYVDTYAATALNPGRNTALEGSLHETEFIAPVTRDGDPVSLVGYVFERDDCLLATEWRAALSRLQLGGERTYGWGRVQGTEPLTGAPFFDGWETALDGARPCLMARGDRPRLLAHTVATDDAGPAGLRGTVEPLVGRETREAGRHGQYIAPVQVCWKPGLAVPTGTRVRVGPDGLWEFIRRSNP